MMTNKSDAVFLCLKRSKSPIGILLYLSQFAHNTKRHDKSLVSHCGKTVFAYHLCHTIFSCHVLVYDAVQSIPYFGVSVKILPDAKWYKIQQKQRVFASPANTPCLFSYMFNIFALLLTCGCVNFCNFAAAIEC